MPAETYQTMTLDAAVSLADDSDLGDLIRQLHSRVTDEQVEMQRFREWCDRADKLYYPETYTRGGADLFPEDPNLKIAGRSHVSINTAPMHVDVPSSLQAVEPIENMMASDDTPEARSAAAHTERLYAAWKVADKFDVKWHKACTVKELYGRTAGFVYWDANAPRGDGTFGRTCIDVIEQPRNLWLGYQNDNYDKPEWAALVQMMTPNAVAEEFGVDMQPRVTSDGKVVVNPFTSPDVPAQFNGRRPWLQFAPAMIEVWNYWYRKPVWSGKGKNRKARMETWNVVFAGTEAVRGPYKYPEYKGLIPFLPLFNTFVPGVPDGRPALRDVEPLIREKMELIAAGSSMIRGGTGGDFWQMVGPEAPLSGKIQPTRNKVVYPGPGNRIETITPFIAQFQLEQHLGRLDKSESEISGLNDLLKGLAPAQVLSSSKAINALIANYETRMSMPRLLLYGWRKDLWDMNVMVTSAKDKAFKKVMDAGGGVLDIRNPSLQPRDEMETMTRALNAMNGKLASQRTAMDWIGIDDPEQEQELIREERTDATLFPEAVEVMAQLMSILANLQLPAPGGAAGQAGGQMASGQADLRSALGMATPDNTTGQAGAGGEPSMDGMTPPIPGAAPEAGGAPGPFAQGPTGGQTAQMQTMIQGGESKGRILTQQKLGRR
jgi:hypothetical protein